MYCALTPNSAAVYHDKSKFIFDHCPVSYPRSELRSCNFTFILNKVAYDTSGNPKYHGQTMFDNHGFGVITFRVFFAVKTVVKPTMVAVEPRFDHGIRP